MNADRRLAIWRGLLRDHCATVMAIVLAGAGITSSFTSGLSGSEMRLRPKRATKNGTSD